MSVREVTMYRAVCDGCGEEDREPDYFAWAGPDQAVDRAVTGAGWLRIIEGESGQERLYCGGCTAYPEDADEYVPKGVDHREGEDRG